VRDAQLRSVRLRQLRLVFTARRRASAVCAATRARIVTTQREPPISHSVASTGTAVQPTTTVYFRVTNGRTKAFTACSAPLAGRVNTAYSDLEDNEQQTDRRTDGLTDKTHDERLLLGEASEQTERANEDMTVTGSSSVSGSYSDAYIRRSPFAPVKRILDVN